MNVSDNPGVVHILLAHGSRSKIANRAFLELVERVGGHLAGHRLCAAFWELAEPGLEEAVVHAVATEGARRVVVLPYFLSDGLHIRRDIPRAMTALRERFPEVELVCLPSLQNDPLLEALLVRRLEDA